MGKEHFLKGGEQVFVSDLVREHVARIDKSGIEVPARYKNIPEVLKIGYKTAEYIDRHIPFAEGIIRHPKNDAETQQNEAILQKLRRSRTIDGILRGILPSCADIGMAFRALMIGQGIPVAYIETFHESAILYGKSSGHICARIFDGDKSYIGDPTSVEVYSSEEEMFSKKMYVIFKEGLDSWDIGLRTPEDVKNIISNPPLELVLKYQRLLKQDFREKMKISERRMHNP
jgi:hypothetical protein